jgi:hypothetical protein
MASSPDIKVKQGAGRATENAQKLPRPRGIEDEVKEVIVGDSLTSAHSILLGSDEIAHVAWRPTIRHVHQLTGLVYLERKMRYGIVSASMAHARQDKPAVVALGAGGTRQGTSRRPALGAEARVNHAPSLWVKENRDAQRAVVAGVKHNRARLQTHVQEMIRQLDTGTSVLHPATNGWAWRTCAAGRWWRCSQPHVATPSVSVRNVGRVHPVTPWDLRAKCGRSPREICGIPREICGIPREI